MTTIREQASVHEWIDRPVFLQVSQTRDWKAGDYFASIHRPDCDRHSAGVILPSNFNSTSPSV